jgi:hypothetical protein
MKDKSSKLLTFWNTWIEVGTPNFDKKMEANVDEIELVA